jgi:hypothetical protein
LGWNVADERASPFSATSVEGWMNQPLVSTNFEGGAASRGAAATHVNAATTSTVATQTNLRMEDSCQQLSME